MKNLKEEKFWVQSTQITEKMLVRIHQWFTVHSWSDAAELLRLSMMYMYLGYNSQEMVYPTKA